MLLGEIIKHYRTIHELSAEEFSKLAGLSRVYISNIENNYNPKTKKPIVPTSNVLQKCAKAMGVSLDDLLVNLSEDQLVNVVYKDFSDSRIYERTPDLDMRYNYFTEEICNRDDVLLLNGIPLDEWDRQIMLTVLNQAWLTMRELITEKHNKAITQISLEELHELQELKNKQ